LPRAGAVGKNPGRVEDEAQRERFIGYLVHYNYVLLLMLSFG
jgi:hypothetical protein